MSVSNIVEFFASIIPTVFGFVGTFLNSILNGIAFVFSLFTTIPNFLMQNFFPNLPPFFETGLYGLMGFMLFILVTKIIISIKG